MHDYTAHNKSHQRFSAVVEVSRVAYLDTNMTPFFHELVIRGINCDAMFTSDAGILMDQ